MFWIMSFDGNIYIEKTDHYIEQENDSISKEDDNTEKEDIVSKKIRLEKILSLILC